MLSRNPGSLSGLTLPEGDSAGVVPRNTVTSTNFTEMEGGMKRKSRISTAGADVSRMKASSMTTSPVTWGLNGNSGLHPQRHNSFCDFQGALSQTRPKQRPGHSESLHTSSVAFLPGLGCKPQHTGHAPVWISRLGLSFPLQLQLNKVFLQTSCPNLCYAAVGC